MWGELLPKGWKGHGGIGGGIKYSGQTPQVNAVPAAGFCFDIYNPVRDYRKF